MTGGGGPPLSLTRSAVAANPGTLPGQVRTRGRGWDAEKVVLSWGAGGDAQTPRATAVLPAGEERKFVC